MKYVNFYCLIPIFLLQDPSFTPKIVALCVFVNIFIGGSGGGVLGGAFIFMQFFAKFLPNNRFSPQTQGLARPVLANGTNEWLIVEF